MRIPLGWNSGSSTALAIVSQERWVGVSAISIAPKSGVPEFPEERVIGPEPLHVRSARVNIRECAGVISKQRHQLQLIVEWKDVAFVVLAITFAESGVDQTGNFRLPDVADRQVDAVSPDDPAHRVGSVLPPAGVECGSVNGRFGGRHALCGGGFHSDVASLRRRRRVLFQWHQGKAA